MYSVLFESDNYLIVNKASGVLVHKTKYEDEENLMDCILKSEGNQSYFLVNRIDRFTSGIVILAKNRKTLKLTQQLFLNREIEKTYLAIVSKELPAKTVKINLSIGRSLGNKLMFSNRNAKNYKPASTEVVEIERKFVLVRPITGRTHQIRCHLRDIGSPILNDPIYGKEIINEEFGQFLHAYRVRFTCPVTFAPIEVIAPLPKEFLGMLKELNINSKGYE